jgi:hypothetical protein
MQSFSTWVRRIATGILAVVAAIFTGIVFPVVAHFIQEQPQETANVALKLLHVVLKFLYDLSEQTWLRITVSLFVGFVAGLWVDWFLRRLDGSRADRRKKLGIDMLKLAHNLGDFARRIDGDPMNAFRPQITSCFATARKLGMWIPDDRIFSIYSPHAMHGMRADAMDLIMEYLTQVGTMLKEGNFCEAKRDAKKSEANFTKAYAQHRLPST